MREITRKIDEQINSVRRELANLLSIGIIASDNTNNRLYYEVNQSYEFYEPLLAIFGQGSGKVRIDKAKVADKTATEREKIKALGNVEVALYTGQFTRDESSGVDFLLVGDVNHHAIQKFIKELEEQEGKEVRYALMAVDEFDYRRQVKDKFITTVLGAKKQILIDKNGTLS